ncbi:MAG: 50S ribosomal protein L3 [Dehalococcoidia bacterium]|nr:50S ribosomal protein L3 [Dehalococcoidia bacterium]
MIQGLLGRKLGMTQHFGENGNAEAATIIEAGPCTVVQVKTPAVDGYTAARLGFGQAKRQGAVLKGQGRGFGEFKYLREFRLSTADGVNVGDKLDVSLFKPGDKVTVTGISKGHGFAGTVKRYNFRGGPKTHGQSDRQRAPGSIGATTTPGRVYKGTLMAGHMGHARVTVRNLEVIKADSERNILLVKGAVPGAKNGLLLIGKSNGRNE